MPRGSGITRGVALITCLAHSQIHAMVILMQPTRNANSQNEHQDAPCTAAQSARASRQQERAYCQAAALCFECDTTRKDQPTVRVEAALATGYNKFDWTNKIAVQLSVDELATVVAVFLGWVAKCEYRYHGEDRNKGFSIENQPGHMLVRLNEGGEPPRAIPVDPARAFAITSLLFDQLAANYPRLQQDALLNVLRFSVGRLANKSSIGVVANERDAK